jgi:hypothetical protein
MAQSSVFFFLCLLLFFLYCCAGWEYLVTFTKVLTKYQLFILKFTPLPLLFISPSPDSWNSHNSYMHVYTFFALQSSKPAVSFTMSYLTFFPTTARKGLNFSEFSWLCYAWFKKAEHACYLKFFDLDYICKVHFAIRVIYSQVPKIKTWTILSGVQGAIFLTSTNNTILIW